LGDRSFQKSFFLQPIGHDLLNKMRHRAPIVLCCFFERRPNILIEPAEWPWTSPAKRELIEEINTAIGREAFAEAQTDELVFQHGTNQ
jgi:hypothetical protein